MHGIEMQFTITPRQAMIARGAQHYHTMNFIPQYSMNSGKNSVGVHAGADMACISKCGMCQNNTGGVSGGYGSVEHQHLDTWNVTCWDAQMHDGGQQ